jgi:hypothetical protein
VSTLYHLLTRYLLLFIHTIFSSFRLLGNSRYDRCAPWVIATVNSYLLQSWQEHNMKIMEMLLCCTVVFSCLLHLVLLSLCQEVDFPIWVFRRGEFNMSWHSFMIVIGRNFDLCRCLWQWRKHFQPVNLFQK